MLLRAHALEEPPPLSRVAPSRVATLSRLAGGALLPELENIAQRALAKNPADRFQSAAEFEAALKGVAVALQPPPGWVQTTGLDVESLVPQSLAYTTEVIWQAVGNQPTPLVGTHSVTANLADAATRTNPVVTTAAPPASPSTPAAPASPSTLAPNTEQAAANLGARPGQEALSADRRAPVPTARSPWWLMPAVFVVATALAAALGSGGLRALRLLLGEP